MNVQYHFLEKITNSFADEFIIGKGGFGDVYKGVLDDGWLIAVKLLHPLQGLDDKLFNREVGNLLSVEHPNIVRLLCYCHETHSRYVEHNGENVLCKHVYRAICLEYFQGGSLDKHLDDQSFAPNWVTRYNIIKGICEGLNFLHRCEPPIFHLDLKPANILLDSSMVPKVADFGLSRLFSGSHTHVTKEMKGTVKYMPPESIKQSIISPKNDVFSLGVVIIDIMRGPAGYSQFHEMGDVTQFTQEVLTDWRNVINGTSKFPIEELHQVKTCIDTAMRCIEPERNNRPTVAGILDTLNNTETRRPKRQLADTHEIEVGNTMAKKLKTMISEVDHITKKQQSSNFMPKDSFNFNVQQVPDIRATSSNVEKALIIGRTKEKQKILSLLCMSFTKDIVILPIYGIGGIGKTTLAQLVYNDTQFQGYSRVWVYVSQEFNLYKIGSSIISQLSNEISHITDKQMLHNRLRKLLGGKRILIVLDDMWTDDPSELDELNSIIRLGLGSKVAVIVTTRDEAIASLICSNTMPYKLETLTDDMCWAIIKQKSDFQNRPDKKQLEKIGRDIAIKSGGVALAAQSLGYMLRLMKSDQWESVRNSDIWNSTASEDISLKYHGVLASLRLSYSRMHEYLQSCFSYCAVFMKGHNIAKYDLIHQWIALEFIKPSGIFDSMQLGEQYVAQLLGMSFLQCSMAPSGDGQQDKGVTLFTMHDLVHDLARAELADKVNKKGKHVGNGCHYALLSDCSKPLQFSMSCPENTWLNFFLKPFQEKGSLENIKAHFVDCGKIEVCGLSFSPAKCLPVLDLSECFTQKLPDSVSQLKQLRYLHAPRIQDQMVPNCISKLTKLNYLNLRGSRNISALPEAIGDVKGLMHLDLSGCESISELPASFAELKELVHLDLSHCHVSVSEALAGFTKLQYLNLSVASERAAKHIKVLPEVIANLTKLRYLNLSKCLLVMAPSKDEIHRLLISVSTLSNLEHLDFSHNSKLTSLPESMGNLMKLHTLDLSECNLRKFPSSMAKMVSLKIVTVRNMDKSALPESHHFASLPNFVVCVSPSECSSNLHLLQPTNPNRMNLSRLENVMSVEEAQSIKLMDKRGMKELTLKWTVDSERRCVDDKDVLEKLVPPNTIRSWYISGYNSPGFPNWLMGIGLYLPNLCKMDLWDFPKCNNLPPLGQLPNLELLTLYHMDSLEEWNTTYSTGEGGANELMFPKLKTVYIRYCTKLRIKPCLPRAVTTLFIEGSDNIVTSGETSASFSSVLTYLDIKKCMVPLHQWSLLQHVSGLRSLTISECIDLTKCSPQVVQRLSSLESLSLRKSSYEDDHAQLPTWLVELTSLQHLCITLPKLEKLNDRTKQLTRLESLSLMECRSMTSVPQWLGELASLKLLIISECEGISSLPDSIQQLTKLERLRIYRASPTLMKWCESEENKMKLAHIRGKVFS